MKYFLSIVCLLSFFLANAQTINNEEKQKGASRFEIAFSISPDLCYRTLEIAIPTAVGASLVYDNREKNEVIKPGFTTGINGCYSANNRIGIEAGLLFSDKGYNYKWSSISLGSPLDPRFGFNGDTNNILVKMKQNYHNYYFDIPVSVKYFWGKNKIRFVGQLGITANLFIKESVTTLFEYSQGDRDRSSEESNYHYEALNISPFAGFGINYQLSPALSVSAEPVFRYGVLRIIKNEPLTAYLWNAGLNLSFRYRF